VVAAVEVAEVAEADVVADAENKWLPNAISHHRRCNKFGIMCKMFKKLYF
jgi:hypothetical protein